MSLSSEEFARLKLFLSQQSSTPTHVHANIITSSAPLQTSGILALTSFAFKLNTLNTSEWIIDTGASDHICSSMSILTNPIPISHITVTLPNGSSLSATNTGSVRLSSHLQLSNVLYVPGFSFNLLSVSRLTQSLNVSVEFCVQQCRILDLLSQKMIGIAYQTRGLYLLLPDSSISPSFFHVVPSPLAVVPIVAAVQLNLTPQNLDMWHCRLGHPSSPRIQMIHKHNPSVTLPSHSHCSVCHLAKQKNLPFSSSSSHATVALNLFIWIYGGLSALPHMMVFHISLPSLMTLVDVFGFISCEIKVILGLSLSLFAPW
ncbi:Retrovirus-related Pol polyprotein from transposon RE1 [Linum perenne]